MMKSIATRDAFGDALVELGHEDPRIFVIDCDISKSTKTTAFAELFPERHLNVGIAEQNAASLAAGLSLMGKIPFISTYAVFGSMRMTEQIRTSVCYSRLNVKLACSHGGLTPGSDGATHQSIEDLGIMRSIPNMTIIMGADYIATKKLVKEAAQMDGPVYLRFTRDPVPVYYTEDDSFVIGDGKLLHDGNDLTIITFGEMLHQGVLAADVLEKKGISVRLVDIHTLKPLDRELIIASIKKTGKVITVEDHNYLNGLGSAVAEIIAELGFGRLCRIGVQDTFCESGQYEMLLAKYLMDAPYIVKMAEKMLQSL